MEWMNKMRTFHLKNSSSLWSRWRTNWPKMTQIILIGRISSGSLLPTGASIFPPTTKCLTSSVFWKSTERNARLRVITRRLRKHAESLMSCSGRRLFDRKITSEQLKNKNCKILVIFKVFLYLSRILRQELRDFKSEIENESYSR